MEKVIIVESPSKSHTISHYLNGEYEVLSSKGHINDLAMSGKGGLGIDIENNFKPTYIIDKNKIKLVNDLIKECKGKKVYLATDPDREGEAIAYHLANALKLDLDDLNRIEFHEITKPAVLEALKNPKKIDLKMVDSQETRRIIDRILGFKLSKLFQRKIGAKSAGRVQSVALLLIVNLEKEIKAFVPTKYYELEAIFPNFKLKLKKYKDVEINANNRIVNRKELETLKSRLMSFRAFDIQNKMIQKSSFPTYTTSTMQQDASIKLGFSATKTMSVAQKLYEGISIGSSPVGLITYMRTDSTRLSDIFVKSANNYILNTYGNRYLGGIKVKEQKGMQDAHEGIRPTDVYRTPESIKSYLTNDEYKLYNLIYNRCLASLMSNAIYNQTTILFENTDSVFELTGKTLTFDGYLKIYGKTDEDKSSFIPNVKLGDSFNATSIEILDLETKPKSRYTEASLIKDMEEKGIGRPSTYAQTIAKLYERKYIINEKKSLVPTEMGITVTDNAVLYFNSLINVKYTAEMETALDKIAQGSLDKLDELNAFYDEFSPLLEEASEKMTAKYPIPTDEICPECGQMLVIRNGEYGEFIACSNYPKCRYIKNDNEEAKEIIDTGIICPNCNTGHLVQRTSSRGKSKGSIFYGCSNYPKCKATFTDEPTNEKCPNCKSMMLKDSSGNLYCSNHCDTLESSFDNVACPNCKKGHLVLRVAAKGKNKGNEFYGCSNYPRCKTLISIEEYNKLKS